MRVLVQGELESRSLPLGLRHRDLDLLDVALAASHDRGVGLQLLHALEDEPHEHLAVLGRLRDPLQIRAGSREHPLHSLVSRVEDLEAHGVELGGKLDLLPHLGLRLLPLVLLLDPSPLLLDHLELLDVELLLGGDADLARLLLRLLLDEGHHLVDLPLDLRVVHVRGDVVGTARVDRGRGGSTTRARGELIGGEHATQLTQECRF